MIICSYNQSNTNACARRICGPTPICYCQMTPVSPNWQVCVEGCSYPTLLRRSKEAKQNFVWTIKIINLFLSVSPPPSRQVYLKQDNKIFWNYVMALLRTYIHIHPVLPTSFLLVLVQSFSVVLIVFLSFSVCIVKSCEIAFSLVPFWFWVVKLF
jgi:hypothetical protein